MRLRRSCRSRKERFSWQNFAGRVVLSIAAGVLAAYAAAQGDRQQEIERSSGVSGVRLARAVRETNRLELHGP